jgi:hypothetical protein
MKLTKLSILALVGSLAACSSTKTVNPDEAIRSQTLNTTFADEGVKVITDCKWYKPLNDDCEIVAIEATASTWTNGATAVQVSEARKVARAEAYANVAHFIKTQITSTRVVSTVAKHVEVAKDQFNGQKESEMTDKEAKNISRRENSNDTARTVTRTVREHSESVLSGFREIKTEKIGQQEIAVTIRWDKDSDRAARQMRQKFGGQ